MLVGDVLAGRYELEELAGSGGMSTVFRAHDRVLERTVALKVLHQRYNDEDEYVERFRREARMAAGLSHQNIVTVIDRGEHEGRQFIVFEYVDGDNLKELVDRAGPLPVERALVLGIEIASGLAFAHANGLVHRDVKPQNVLLNGDGNAKVTDFGIARSLDVAHGVTQTGTVLGTSDYIAPEQAQGRPVGERTDVYSLGVVLYELLTGELPFAGDNFVAVAMQHINEPAPRVSARRPDVPPRLDAAIATGAREGSGRPVRAHGRLRPRAPGVPRRGRAGTRAARRRRCCRRPQRCRAGVAASRAPLVLDRARAGAARRRSVARRAEPVGTEGGGSSAAASRSAAPVTLQGVGAWDPLPGDGEEHDAKAPRARPTATRRPTGRPRPTTRRRASASRVSGSCSTPAETVSRQPAHGDAPTRQASRRDPGRRRPQRARSTTSPASRRSGRGRRSTSTTRRGGTSSSGSRASPPGGAAHVNEVDAS